MNVELIGGSELCTKHVCAAVRKSAAGVLVAMVSTEEVDSDGDVIHQGKNKQGAGWVLDRFNKAPVLTWGHEIWRPSISAPDTRAKVRGREDGAKGRALFLDPFSFDMDDPFAASIAGKYERNVLSETSVGFVGRVFEKRVDGENVTGRDWYEQELLEVAAVNRGANPGTTTHMRALLTRSDLSALVQGGADNEVRELKEEIAHLTDEMKAIANAVKVLGDALAVKVDVHAALLDAKNDHRAVLTARDEMALSLLKRLQDIGTAR